MGTKSFIFASRLAGLGRRTLDTLGTEFTDDANYQGPTPWDEAEKVPVRLELAGEFGLAMTWWLGNGGPGMVLT